MYLSMVSYTNITPIYIHDTESLALFNTGISGEIPDLSKLQKLELFKVENCNLSGSGHMSLYSIPTLIVLGVAGNRELTGTLEGIGGLTKLQELYTGETQMSGTLPDGMGNLSNLRVIMSPNTNFTGPIPASFGSLTSLTTLNLATNELTGALAAELGGMINLEEILLYNNGE